MYYFKFGRLNIAFTTKEEGNMRIPENREKVLKKFSLSEIFIPKQKHTSKITNLDNLNIEADGLYTDRINTPIGVLTADCMAVVISNMEKIVLLHAGWRGLVNGIIEEGLRLFDDLKNIKAFISPSIRDCCYEIQEDFINVVKEKGISDKYFAKRKNKIYFSLQKLAKDKLRSYGIDDITDISLCTKCDGEFFSYRNGDFDNRILTFSWLSEE
ncbi:polyphenol oxidase family protein [Persephonella sp.]